MPSEREQVVALLVVAGALVVLGVDPMAMSAADTPDPEVPPDTLLTEASETVEEQPISGIRTETIRRPNERREVTVAVREDPPHRSRIEVVDVTDADSETASESAARRTVAGDEVVPVETTVINGSIQWHYYSDEERVIRQETDGYWISETQSFGMHAREMLDVLEPSYAGTEVVEGRETYVVELEPPDDETVDLSLDLQVGDAETTMDFQQFQNETWSLAKETWWIDVETRYPIKQRIEWADRDGTIVASTTRVYEDLEVGVEFDDDRFEFDPPAETEVTEPTRPNSDRYDTREAAADAVSFPLPDPELSAEYELVNVMVQNRGNVTSAVLLYFDGNTSISIGVRDGDPITGENDVVATNVGEIGGTIVAHDGRPFISWGCGELAYRVHGPPDVDTLVGTAESVGCEVPST